MIGYTHEMAATDHNVAFDQKRLLSNQTSSGQPGTSGILLVDDDVLRTEITKVVLASKFPQGVHVVHDAWSAVEKLASSSFELLVTDFHMPHINGFQLARVVKALWPEVPILMLTGDSSVPTA